MVQETKQADVVEEDELVYHLERKLRRGGMILVDVRRLGGRRDAVNFKVRVDRSGESDQERLERANRTWKRIMEGREETEAVLMGKEADELADKIRNRHAGKR